MLRASNRPKKRRARVLRVGIRRTALALQGLCEGPLGGMFDRPTMSGLDLDARWW